MNEHRELCRRQHSILAAYAMHVCWARKIRTIFVSRESLERYLGLEHFRPERKDWIREDIKPYFARTVDEGRGNRSSFDTFGGMWWIAEDLGNNSTRDFSIKLNEMRNDTKHYLFKNREQTLEAVKETEIIAFLTSVAIGFYPETMLHPSGPPK